MKKLLILCCLPVIASSAFSASQELIIKKGDDYSKYINEKNWTSVSRNLSMFYSKGWIENFNRAKDSGANFNFSKAKLDYKFLSSEGTLKTIGKPLDLGGEVQPFDPVSGEYENDDVKGYSPYTLAQETKSFKESVTIKNTTETSQKFSLDFGFFGLKTSFETDKITEKVLTKEEKVVIPSQTFNIGYKTDLRIKENVILHYYSYNYVLQMPIQYFDYVLPYDINGNYGIVSYKIHSVNDLNSAYKKGFSFNPFDEEKSFITLNKDPSTSKVFGFLVNLPIQILKPVYEFSTVIDEREVK